MEYNSYVEERHRLVLLDKLKEQYESYAGRPRLYELLSVQGVRIPAPTYEWMHSGGQGNYSLSKVTPEEKRAIRHLLHEGKIVPALTEAFDTGGSNRVIRRIKHFDDVNFGLDENSAPIIYEYARSKEQSDPVIRPDQQYDAAIRELKKRIEYGRADIDTQPIQLQDGPTIWPVHTDPRIMGLRVRQHAYVPHSHMAP